MNAQRLPIPPRSAAVLAACVLLVLAFAPAQYFGRQQDDVLFFLGARALTTGRYCLLTTPGCPALTATNIGWPAMLVPLAWLTERPGPFQAFSALLLAAGPVALWAWLRRRADETTALLAAGLFASCPLVLEQSGAVMSDVPYVLLLLAMLAAVEKRRASAAGACGAALLLTRTAGFSIMPALLIPFARERRWRDLARAALFPALSFGLWVWWSLSRGRTVAKFELLPATYSDSGWAKPFTIAASNAKFYAAAWGGCFMPPAWAGGVVATIVGAILATASAWGLVRSLRRRADDPAAWALLGTVCMLSVWGWQYERYMIPLLPLLLWALAAGLGRAAKPALAVFLALQLGAQTLPRLGHPGPWAAPELARTYEWLASRPAPNLLSGAEPIRDGWLSGLPNVSLPVTERDEDFTRALKVEGVRYVLRVDGQDYGLEHDETSALRREVERDYKRLEDPRRFRKVHEEPAERAAVYEPL